MAEEKKENTENQVDNETKESQAETVENEKAEENPEKILKKVETLEEKLNESEKDVISI